MPHECAAAIIAIAIVVPSSSSRSSCFVTAGPPHRRARRRRALRGDRRARRDAAIRRSTRSPTGRRRRAGRRAARSTGRSAPRSTPVRRRRRVPCVPPDPETVGVTRRQFFNRGIVTLMGVGLGGFGAAGSSPSCGRRLTRRLRRQDHRRQARRHPAEHPRRATASSTSPRPHVGHRVPGGAAAEGQERSTAAAADRHGGGHHRAVPEVPAPRLPCARVRTSQWFECPCHGSQYNRVGEKKGGPRRAAWTASASRSRHGNVIDRHRHRSSTGPPIGTNTTGQEAEGPHCITVAGRTDGDQRRRDRARRRSAIASDHRRSSLRRLDRLLFVINRQVGAPSSAPRSSSRPTASRTTTTRRSRASASSASSSSACCCSSSSSIGLPLYWLLEPARQAGAVERSRQRSPAGARELFETTADGGFNCAGCHGGMKAAGGSAPYTVTDRSTGEVEPVNWTRRRSTPCSTASATTRSRYILDYGRPVLADVAVGRRGGGPMNEQQIENLVAYIKSIQIPREGCTPRRRRSARARRRQPAGGRRTRPDDRRRPPKPVRRRRHVRRRSARRCSTSI